MAKRAGRVAAGKGINSRTVNQKREEKKGGREREREREQKEGKKENTREIVENTRGKSVRVYAGFSFIPHYAQLAEALGSYL